MTTAIADRPLDVETISPGARRQRRIEAAIGAAQNAFADGGSRSDAARDLLFIESQVEAAEGAIDPGLLLRVDSLRVALGLAPRAAAVVPAAKLTAVASTSAKVTTSNIVAGAQVAGSGILIGWWGKGELVLGRIVEVLGISGIARDLAPSAVGTEAQLAAAVRTLQRGGLVARSVEVLEGSDHVSRWIVGLAVDADQDASIGDAFGRRHLVVTLAKDGTIDCDGNDEMAATVRAEYQRRIDAEVLSGAKVSAWLTKLLRTRFAAAKLGGNWYIRAEHVAEAGRLTAALSAVWGKEWMPAIPVATTDQLRRGLAAAFIEEAQAVLEDLADKRSKAREAGRPDITPRMAAGLLVTLREIAERAVSMGQILGEDAIGNVRAEVLAVVATVDPLCDVAAQRGALIWDEITA